MECLGLQVDCFGNSVSKPCERSESSAASLTWLPHQRQNLFAALVLTALLSFTFYSALSNDFVNYDDPEYVLENARIQSGLNWQTVRWAFSSGYAANWHPLTWLSHALDYRLFHLQAWGHHLTSVLLHLTNAVLLFIFLERTTGSVSRSLVVAALFGVHPLHVESIAWVSERKDVLSSLFWILGMLSYQRYVSRPGNERTGRRLYYGLTLLLFALGLLSKPMVITFPFCLMLLDYWPGARFDGGGRPLSRFLKLTWEKWPFFALSALSALITYLVHLHGSSLASPVYFPLSVRLMNVPVSYCRYLWKMFYPVDLCPFYIHPRTWPVGVIASTTLVLVVVSIAAVRLRLRTPYFFIGWTWFLITLLPVIGIIQTGSQSIADRYTYIPYIGLFIAVCWLIPDFLPRFVGRDILLRSATATTLVALAVLTQHQVAYWKNGETLFQHAVNVEPNNTLAHANLGAGLMQSGRRVEAEQHLREALRLAGEAADKMVGAHLALGMLLTDEGRYDEAILNYRKAVARHPDDAKAHLLLGIALHRIGALDGAIEEFHAAAKLQPDLVEAYNNLGMVHREEGKLDAAVQFYRTALSVQSSFADAHNNLAIALSLQERPQEAVGEFQRAIELDPTSPAFRTNLGAQFEQMDKLDEAVAEYREALRVAPDYAEAREKLSELVARRQKGGTRK